MTAILKIFNKHSTANKIQIRNKVIKDIIKKFNKKSFLKEKEKPI